MMKCLLIIPDGWPCSLSECKPGYFVFNDALCCKTEYKTADGEDEAYCESGEYFLGGAVGKDARSRLVVQPVIAVWEDSPDGS